MAICGVVNGAKFRFVRLIGSFYKGGIPVTSPLSTVEIEDEGITILLGKKN